MESRKVGLYRLCVIMIIFCISIFFLNNNKKKFTTATHIDVFHNKVESVARISLEHAYEQISSLFVSHDIDLIVKVISQFKDQSAYELVDKTLQNSSPFLSDAEKKNILFGALNYCNIKKNIQYDLLDFFLKYPSLNNDIPILLLLARCEYPDLIHLFINWGKDRQKNSGKTEFLRRFVDDAFTVAIANNDYTAVEVMLSKKVRIAQSKASELLWHIVAQNKSSALITLLVHHAQADVNYVNEGRTLLIEAVEKNNINTIRALLDEGAIVDRITDGERGSALRIAIKNKYAYAEQLLREYGAA